MRTLHTIIPEFDETELRAIFNIISRWPNYRFRRNQDTGQLQIQNPRYQSSWSTMTSTDIRDWAGRIPQRPMTKYQRTVARAAIIQTDSLP